jgi:hypothetical protein
MNHLLRLLLVGLALAVLLALASARPAAAKTSDGQASATMSCTDNTATMTRTVLVTITWKKVTEGVDEAEAQAYEPPSTIVLGWDTVPISPPEATGTVQLSFSFNDTTPFGTVQWYLYYGAHIAPIKGGQLDAATFPGCPYP